ncbi:broad-complex core protein isoforms 1/2/3/4/5 [Monomorium pharaonis]|uniref:broad-complex core protein isoforms 1/2/3/4/5 n=1 Tax=Monomorium pharaonis TaxID=307658 RepID=UPI00063EDCDE|nr:broad-complex core protein isoforms 1/2/3/4/5 [Monomorium pharaonis]XP_036148126.1 broad-complex core protein isoforms 1/2/3/4/5 [Monomorium pharaonis]XP_036148127.1 broad-complex core protein isoforms 1/2/3/4/5 [Monomorium pharaonis]XP_036148128.1 broad-complex core protein isoforms 1/2/3/4/5 [Monomorium pharaonis]XP_036148129.1 broad-complex core protein isoforms 1/2/3/4/5 [Monomorium pharaonis]XP_036148130.1 broad-complex core protein isoforms 1/2/3/4/5 [Monomorium pharaonis]XP_03614813
MESGNNLPSPGTYPGGDRQQFCVSWNSHQSNMHSAFPKLLSSEQFVDVTLACDGGSIKCHKVVLSACSDYLERLLLEIPCTHPVIFLRDMKMWELQALVEFMYRGEVYVEQQQLATLMQAAEVLQVRGLSTQGSDNSVNESNIQSNDSNAPATPSTPTHDSNYKADTSSNDDGSTSDFLSCTPMTSTTAAGNNSSTITPPVSNPNSSNFVNMEHSEALQHLEKALSACEATLTETPGMVKMEPDEQFVQQQDVKPYSISMVSSNNCNPSSPFPAIEGYQRRQRRSEEELKQASDMVARGMTFQVASEKYKIPISTIRFYMVRKGILQRRKRGRGSSNLSMNSQPSSPVSPPYQMMNYRLPESLNSSLQ